MSQYTHYRATFDVVPTQEGVNHWEALIRTIRIWIAERIPDFTTLPNGPFYKETTWESHSSFSHIRTAYCAGSGTDETPEFWAVRWENECNDFPKERRWRTDIGVTATGDKHFQFHIETTYSIRPGFIGEQPSSPTPTTPSLVHRLLNEKSWSGIVANGWKLSSEPIFLKPGELIKLPGLLEKKTRLNPVVFVSRTIDTGKTLIDPANLAKVLAGNAFVVVAADTADSNNEMECSFSYGFRCWDGMVRVYLPRIDFQDIADSKRHRYYKADDIDRLGVQIVEEHLVLGLVRQPLILLRPAISSIDDVYDKLRQKRIAVLTAQETAVLTAQEIDRKWKNWLTELDLLMVRNKDLTEKVYSLEFSLAEKDEQADAKDTENARLRFEWEQNKKRLAQSEEVVASLQKRTSVLAGIGTLPKNLIDVVEMMEKMHADKLIFTERAKKSAREYDGVEIDVAWNCLWAMATVLHDLYFGNEKKDIKKEFAQRTRFEVALAEGAQTRNDSRLMKIRKDTYKGRIIDIEPHVIFGNKNGKMLRVHYWASQDDKQLVIGHCGDHLENFTSKSIH